LSPREMQVESTGLLWLEYANRSANREFPDCGAYGRRARSGGTIR